MRTAPISHFSIRRSASRRPAIVQAAFALLSALLIAAAPSRAAAEEPPLWAFQTAAPYAIIIDAETRDVLFAKEPDKSVPPASMSKLITAAVAFDALKNGTTTLETVYEVPREAYQKEGSTMFLDLRDKPTMDELLKGLIIASGNDAAVTIAISLAGTEANFVRSMNAKAKELGLTRSSFANASGLDDPGHLMSVRDLATLALHIIDTHPQYYAAYYSQTEFKWNTGRPQQNRNPLLDGAYDGADGMKTGYTENANFGIVGSAKRGDRRILVVLNGIKAKGLDDEDAGVRRRAEQAATRIRAREVRRALDWAFATFEPKTIAKKGDVVGAVEIWVGDTESVNVVLTEDLRMAVPRRAQPEDLKAVIRYEGPIDAPIKQGDIVAKLVISTPGMEPRIVDVAAAEDVDTGGYFTRLTTAAGWAFRAALEMSGVTGAQGESEIADAKKQAE